MRLKSACLGRSLTEMAIGQKYSTFSYCYFKVGLVVQEWFLRTQPYTKVILVRGYHQELQCVDRGREFLVDLAYPILLLGLQVLVSPFIVRSRRNYKEGLLFTCGSISCLLVGVGWTTAYILFGEMSMEWHDIAVCCGLVTTPTVLNLVVFIPKVRPCFSVG